MSRAGPVKVKEKSKWRSQKPPMRTSVGAAVLLHALVGNAAGFHTTLHASSRSRKRPVSLPSINDLNTNNNINSRGVIRCRTSADDAAAAADVVGVNADMLSGDEMDLPTSAVDDLRGGGGDTSTGTAVKTSASKREMMNFAVPALGIFLTNPLLSNIDNAFVGRTVGATGLAALSPATLCTDQVLYLFSFLARATTGLVSRAYASPSGEGGDTSAAREAASAPLTVSLLCGLVLSVLYASFTPRLLSFMKVNPTLVPKASAYIYWRGAIAWAALAQACCLQIMLATRDAVTPLRIVATAAVLNVLGDYLFCMAPLRWGCAGAAAATSIATLLSSSLMLKALKMKDLLPKIRMPTKREVSSLAEFMGPLMAITITRLLGFVYMQKQAMRLGDLKSLAAFQLCTNIVSFFLLFGEPLSQLSQTKLPSLVDKEDGEGLLANLKSVLTLGLGASVLVGAVAFVVTRFLTGVFTADPAVQSIAHNSAPTVFFMVSNAIMAVTVDGAMLASRDFGWMLFLGLSTFLVQLGVLQRATTLNGIFATFVFRLGVYGPACAIRAAMGKGAIGKAITKTWKDKKKAALEGA